MSHDPHASDEAQIASGSRKALVAGILFTIGLVMVIVTMIVLLKILDINLSPTAPANPKSAAASPANETQRVQLQAYPKLDRLRMEKEAAETLNSYGWEDQNQKIVRVPIERAMQLALAQGFPVRTDAREQIKSSSNTTAANQG